MFDTNLREIDAKHKAALQRQNDDHSGKVTDLNKAHGNTTGAKDKIIKELEEKLNFITEDYEEKFEDLTIKLNRT